MSPLRAGDGVDRALEELISETSSDVTSASIEAGVQKAQAVLNPLLWCLSMTKPQQLRCLSKSRPQQRQDRPASEWDQKTHKIEQEAIRLTRAQADPAGNHLLGPCPVGLTQCDCRAKKRSQDNSEKL